jgi:predicted transcriptional regulator
MSKTIKQIADELGVSKTAIRKRFTDEFKSKYVQTNPDGSLQVTDEGCKLIEKSLRKSVETPQTKFAENSENQGFHELVAAQKETITLLKEELSEKNEQIRTLQAQLTAKDEQIGQITAAMENTAAALNAAQALHAADKKTLMLIEDRENNRKLSFWERRAAKKAEKKGLKGEE